MKSAIERIEAVGAQLEQFHRDHTGRNWGEPFVSVIITARGFHPGIEHGKYGQLPKFQALDEALDALEQFADRLVYADELVAKTLGIAS